MRRPLRMLRVDRADDRMANLAGCSGSTLIQSPIQHQPTADTATEMQIEEILHIASDAESRLGQRDQISIVVKQCHRAEGILDPLLERKLFPAGHAVRKVNHAAARIHWPSEAHTYAHYPV